MAKLEELGKVIETDLLVIGGGVAGLSCAISAKEEYPDVKVAIVDRRVIGKAGQATKAGHGSLYLVPGVNDVETFVEDRVIRSGEYMNDQDMLRQMAEKVNYTLDKCEEWGVEYARNEDGTIQCIPVPVGPWACCALPLGISETLRKKAVSVGVDTYNRIQIIDLVKDGDRIAAAVGVHVESMAFYIFRAKSFILCTSACDFGGQQMFNGMGEGIAMAYYAGAEMRNAEFGVCSDLCAKNDGHPVYGSHMVIHNALGENISMKYAPDAYEVSTALLLGMEKEMEEGRGPLYADLSVNTEQLKAIGFVGNPDDEPGMVDGQRRVWPDAILYHEKIAEKSEKYRQIEDDPTKPLVTAKLAPHSSPISVDLNFKTSLPNLWASGAVVMHGSAHIGWCRGDGVSGMIRHGFVAGPDAAKNAVNVELGAVDPAAVEQVKAKFLAPMQNKGGPSPNEVHEAVMEIVFDSKYMLRRTEEYMKEGLAKLEELDKLADTMYADDGHTLYKCTQVKSVILVTKMVLTAALMRKDSRCKTWRHHRDDYPEADNKNWLKWIMLGYRDGEMKAWTKDIPIENYKYKPADM